MNFQFLKLITGIRPITFGEVFKLFSSKPTKHVKKAVPELSEAWKRIYHDDDGTKYRLIDKAGYVYKVDRAGTQTPVTDKNGRMIRSDTL